MCHLIFLLPIVTLPVFWFLPPQFAVPVYLTSAAFAGLAYWFMRRTMNNPVVTGSQALIGAAGEIVSLNASPRGACLVKAQGELWSARCDAQIVPGDRVVIDSVEGILLRVSPRGKGSPE